MSAALQPLQRFVRLALLRGVARDDIETLLVQNGWSSAQARTALGAWADSSFRLPVPKPQAYLSAREAFIYLLLFTTLYLTAYHLGSLAFDLINHLLPDPADNTALCREGTSASMRWSTSTLLVAFPLFVWLSWRNTLVLQREPVRRLSKVRRWLTYLTLFVAACFLLGDTITLVYNLLGGELTLRFVLKVGVIAAIAGTVFGYYLADLRGDERDA